MIVAESTQPGEAVPTYSQFLGLLHPRGTVFEIRAPNTKTRRGTSTRSGYFDDIEKAAKVITQLDEAGKSPGIYSTLNPVNPDLLSRAPNRIVVARTGSTTSDKDVLQRRWMLVDLDSARPAKTSSTDAELEAARCRADAVRSALRNRGWPAPSLALSGNGYHLLYRIDLPVDDGGLVRRILRALNSEFGDENIGIDVSVHNPARITKAIGTKARKGDPTAERPHRRSELIDVPNEIVAVPRELLEQIQNRPTATPVSLSVSNAPHRDQAKLSRQKADQFKRFDHSPEAVRQYLTARGVHVKGDRRKDGGTWLYLDRCPVVADCVSENPTDIGVFVGDDGSIAYKNQHNRGEGLTWLDIRETYEPGYKQFAEEQKHRRNAIEAIKNITNAADVFDHVDDLVALPAAKLAKTKQELKDKFGKDLNRRDLDKALNEARQKQRRHDPTEIPYRETPHGLIWLSPTKDGRVPVPLTNFTARVTGDVIFDDGAEAIHHFEIQARIGDRVRTFAVPAARFSSMHWAVEHLGAAAAIYPGFTVVQHARFAIQQLSGDPPRQLRYGHIGWRKIGDTYVYIYAGGAIGPDGPVADVETDLHGALANYVLPVPPADAAPAVTAALKILDLAPDHVIVPAFCVAWRAVLGGTDSTLHLVGQTGVFKTELAALLQQHYGQAMDARHVPGSWTSTGNALEVLGFAAKDAVLVIDDFSPGGNVYDVQKMHREADRVLRGQGNRSARGRLRPDGTLRPATPPRGLIVSTGEDTPRGQSLRSRVLIIEIEQNDIDADQLTQCQQDATAGLYSSAMSAFIQWLAPRYERSLTQLPALRDKLRTNATQSNSHRRTPAIVADLFIGAQTFLKFAQQIGAITDQQRDALKARMWVALNEVAAAQATHQAASDPARRFIELLGSALVARRAYVTDDAGRPPPDSHLWGWRIEKDRKSGADVPIPNGERVGWVVDDDLYLDPNAAYAVAQRMGQSTGDGLAVTAPTLRRRLRDRGLLATWDQARGKLTVRITLEGSRRAVIHLKGSTLMVRDKGPNRPNGPTPPTDGSETAASGPVDGPVVEPAHRKSAQENGPSEAVKGGDGSDGTVGPISEPCKEHQDSIDNRVTTDGQQEVVL